MIKTARYIIWNPDITMIYFYILFAQMWTFSRDSSNFWHSYLCHYDNYMLIIIEKQEENLQCCMITCSSRYTNKLNLVPPILHILYIYICFELLFVWRDSTVNTVIWHVVNARFGHCVTTSLENARNDVSLLGRDQNVIVSW